MTVLYCTCLSDSTMYRWISALPVDQRLLSAAASSHVYSTTTVLLQYVVNLATATTATTATASLTI